MQFLQHASINRKLTWLVATAVATALALAYAAFVISDVRTARESLVEQMSALANVLASNSAAALTFEDEKSAQQILESLALEPSVESASIYGADGHRFVNYPELDSASLQTASMSPTDGLSFDADGHLNVTTPIVAAGERIGTFQLHATMERVYRQFLRYSLSMGLVLLLSFGAAHLLASRLQRIISQPILTLAHAAQRVSAEQDYSIRVSKVDNDELGVLFDEFNHMLDEVVVEQTGCRSSS